MSVFLIAEAGVNHNGDILLAKKLIDAAAESGADAVKFQTWKTELLVTHSAKQAEYQTKNTQVEESQFDMLSRLELSYDNFRELKVYCDQQGITFLSTPDEKESARFLSDLQTIFKIGSGELTNVSFLKYIGMLKKEVILSTGMGTLAEVEVAINVLMLAGTPRNKITLLHATTQYPTPMEEVNLKAMLTLQEAFKIKVGYSDHTMGIEIAIAAAALGAQVIEKHFTLSRDMVGPDHKASLEPTELKKMVLSIRNIEVALGDGLKIPQVSEQGNMLVVRKSIVASKIIKFGECFSEDNLTVKRVNGGISASFWNEIINLKARRDYKIDDVVDL